MSSPEVSSPAPSPPSPTVHPKPQQPDDRPATPQDSDMRPVSVVDETPSSPAVTHENPPVPMVAEVAGTPGPNLSPDSPEMPRHTTHTPELDKQPIGFLEVEAPVHASDRTDRPGWMTLVLWLSRIGRVYLVYLLAVSAWFSLILGIEFVMAVYYSSINVSSTHATGGGASLWAMVMLLFYVCYLASLGISLHVSMLRFLCQKLHDHWWVRGIYALFCVFPVVHVILFLASPYAQASLLVAVVIVFLLMALLFLVLTVKECCKLFRLCRCCRPAHSQATLSDVVNLLGLQPGYRLKWALCFLAMHIFGLALFGWFQNGPLQTIFGIMTGLYAGLILITLLGHYPLHFLTLIRFFARCCHCCRRATADRQAIIRAAATGTRVIVVIYLTTWIGFLAAINIVAITLGFVASWKMGISAIVLVVLSLGYFFDNTSRGILSDVNRRPSLRVIEKEAKRSRAAPSPDRPAPARDAFEEEEVEMNEVRRSVDADGAEAAAAAKLPIPVLLTESPDEGSTAVLLIIMTVFSVIGCVLFALGGSLPLPAARENPFLVPGYAFPEPVPTGVIYSSCTRTWAGPGEPLTLVDFAAMAALAYVDPSVQDAAMETGFNHSSYEIVHYSCPDHRVCFMDLYSPLDDVSVVSIRGTQELYDWVQDLTVWGEVGLLQAGAWAGGPILGIWPGDLNSRIVNIISLISQWFTVSFQYYTDVQEYVKSIMPYRTQVIMTGHSLGAGLAKIVAAEEDLAAVTFSGPGVIDLEYKLQLNHTRLQTNMFTVIPEADIVPRVGTSEGNVQNIHCWGEPGPNPLWSGGWMGAVVVAGPLTCHAIARTLCELSHACFDKRRRATSYCPELAQ
ncbi:putative Transmembrane protein [Paratrimastix pyriformis]|uniref:Transmembrane protein n=1 Tax=Paratrimastix pyriformis TaxID=342808 RepID=A0ABQ8UQL7_9EUKA|nr:putative Transmembrane protein [Paratrimastix pyriformis]